MRLMLRKIGIHPHSTRDGSTPDEPSEPSLQQGLSLQLAQSDPQYPKRPKSNVGFPIEESISQQDEKTLHRRRGDLLQSPSNTTSSFAYTETASHAGCQPLDPLGLHLVCNKSNFEGDIIFVHGLGGTARKTWSWDRNVKYFWPAWLAEENGLSLYRIFTYGYNANYKGIGTNLNITDFAKDLLFQMLVFANVAGENSPSIGRRPIIFVAHSMGGLVVKKAFVLGKHDNQYAHIISQIYGIMFLGTPHRGARYAKILNNILSTAPLGAPPKAYVEDLDAHSRVLQDINEQFRTQCAELALVSFFETLKTNFGIIKSIIVEKESGVLGYPQETSNPLNADHHTICKFKSCEDENYISVKGMLQLWASRLSQQSDPRPTVSARRTSSGFGLLKRIESILGVRDRVEDELKAHRRRAMRGTCQWITHEERFLDWSKGQPVSRGPSIFWLVGLPAVGKTGLAGHIIEYLQFHRASENCQYHFFSSSHQTKRTAAYCLRSLASQLASTNEEFRERLFQLHEETGLSFSSQDQVFSTIWEKTFEGIIFKMKLEPLYWVLDAFDEADIPSTLISSITKISSSTPVKVLITSRPIRIPSGPALYGSTINTHILSEDDTCGDIRAFVSNAVHDALPGDEQETRKNIVDQVLLKAEGSFLWVRLVLDTLRENWHTEVDIRESLTTIPMGMEHLYNQMLEGIQAQSPKIRLMAKRILTWTACCWRPLNIAELQLALESEFSGFVNLRETIVQICGNFISVDNDKISLIHITARQFLLGGWDGAPAFIDSAQGHEHIAIVCLKYLCDEKWRRAYKSLQNFMVTANGKHIKRNRLLLAEKDHAFLGYSVCYFAYHVSMSPPNSVQLPAQMRYFFTNYSLSWIEGIALSGNLKYLTRSARFLKIYAKRRSRKLEHRSGQSSLTFRDADNDDAENIQAWSVDFIRIVGKFGLNLVQSPSSIYRLVSPLCPSASMVNRIYGTKEGSMVVGGILYKGWDDCLATVSVGKEPASKILATDVFFLTLATSDGVITVWYAETCEKAREIHHGEYISLMDVSRSHDLLATAGIETYWVWDVTTGKQLFHFEKTSRALTMALAFNGAGSELIVGLDDCSVVWYDLESSQQRRQWNLPFEGEFLGCPLTMAISPDTQSIAFAWRGKLPVIWDVSATGEQRPIRCRARSSTDTLFSPLAFQWQTDGNSILILCQSGTLIQWHLYDEHQHEFGHIKPQQMTVSPDGNYLIATDYTGTISIFTFPRLSLIYQLVNEHEVVEGLTISPDGQRFYDIRGTICNVWEPDALARLDDNELEDQGSSVMMEPVIAVDHSSQNFVTALAHGSSDSYFCAGREDGTVCIHDALNGKKLRKVSTHTLHSSVIMLAWLCHDTYIASADDSGRVLVKRVEVRDNNTFGIFPVLDFRLGEPVKQFLLHETSKTLLVSTSTTDRIWSLKTRKEKYCREWTSSQGRRWVQHPFIRELLIWIDPIGVHTYSWKGLDHADSTAPPQQSVRKHSTAPHGQVVHWAALTNNQQVIVYLSGAGHTETRLESGIHLEFLSTSDLQAQHPHSLVSQCMKELVGQIKRLVGTYQDQIVFLDHDYWLCTWRIDAGIDDVKRHFFLPKDWLNHKSLQIASINAHGTFFCPRYGDVAVVRNGMRF